MGGSTLGAVQGVVVVVVLVLAFMEVAGEDADEGRSPAAASGAWSGEMAGNVENSNLCLLVGVGPILKYGKFRAIILNGKNFFKMITVNFLCTNNNIKFSIVLLINKS